MPTIDLLDDVVGIGGPNKGFGFAVVLAEIAVDRGLQVDQRMEHTALQASAGQRGKKAFERIGPGARGRGEMKDPARVSGEPSANLRSVIRLG